MPSVGVHCLAQPKPTADEYALLASAPFRIGEYEAFVNALTIGDGSKATLKRQARRLHTQTDALRHKNAAGPFWLDQTITLATDFHHMWFDAENWLPHITHDCANNWTWHHPLLYLSKFQRLELNSLLQRARNAAAAAAAAEEEKRTEEAVDAFLESDSEEGAESDASDAGAPLPSPKRPRAEEACSVVSIPKTIVTRVREWTRRWRRDSRLRQRMLPLLTEEQRGRCVGFWVDGVNQCRWRETPVPLAAQQVDHKRRVADGGGDERSNLQMLCACCHSMKTANER